MEASAGENSSALRGSPRGYPPPGNAADRRISAVENCAMGPIKSPGAVAAHGASVTDQLGRQVGSETNRQQQLPQAAIRRAGAADRVMMADSNAGAQRRPVFRTPEQRSSDLLAAQEFQQITKFAAACRRQWPGARIVLRPTTARKQVLARRPPNQNLHQKGPDHVSGI